MANVAHHLDIKEATPKVREAIRRSISHNEIVTLRPEAETQREILIASLEELSADSVNNRGIAHEFWGEDEDGNEWRVHVAELE